ncbi:MAG: hypothetical protein ACYCX5_12585 [Coriobacteriia bacterium]
MFEKYWQNVCYWVIVFVFAVLTLAFLLTPYHVFGAEFSGNYIRKSNDAAQSLNITDANGLSVKSYAHDHGYISYFIRLASPGVRNAYVGFPDAGVTNFAIRNELTGGAITLSTTDGGPITANGGTIWHSINDGAGSGLDADTLDGINSSGFWQPVNDGAGSGLDADTLDGINSSGFWQPGNDGAGSGLDADTLDGINSSGFWQPGNDGAGSGLDADLWKGKGYLDFSAALDFPEIAAGSAQTLQITGATGVSPGDFCLASESTGFFASSTVLDCVVNTTDVVTVRLTLNAASGTFDPVSMTYHVRVFKR